MHSSSVIFTLLTLFAISVSLTSGDEISQKKNINFKNIGNSSEFQDETKSLTGLIYEITRKYFEGCDLETFHDENFAAISSFSNFYKNFPISSFVKRSKNHTEKGLHYQRKNKCYNRMIFLNDIFTIHKVMERESKNKIIVVCDSTPWNVKDFLKSYSSRFYVNLLIITHSLSRRMKRGTFLLYTHKLFTDGSGTTEPFLITSWINNTLTDPEVNLFPKKLQEGFRGHRILVAAPNKPPFVMPRRSGSKIFDWDGIDVRIVKLLGEVLNFTAEFRETTSSNLSSNAAAINDIKIGNAAAAIGGIYKTLDIVEEFDTAVSHMHDCASFISRASTALPKYRAVMGPFQLSVWLMLCAVYIIAIIPLSLNSEYGLKSVLTKPKNLDSMFWYVFSTFTNSFCVKNPMLNSGLGQNSTAILIGIYWVFTIIITSCYTGSIMAFITVPVYPTPIETADQLLRNRYQIATLELCFMMKENFPPKFIQIGRGRFQPFVDLIWNDPSNHDGWEEMMNSTSIDDPVAIKLLKNVQYVPSVKDGIRNASRAYFWPYAFLGSQILLEYIVQAEFAPNWSTKRSLMHISNECFVRYGVTIVLPIESIYTETFNKVILRAQQSGFTEKIIRDVEWDFQRSSSGKLLSASGSKKIQRIEVEERQLAVDDTQGMFLILGAGILIGFFALSIECCVHQFEKRCNSIEDSSEFSSEQFNENNFNIWINTNENYPSYRRYSSVSV